MHTGIFSDVDLLAEGRHQSWLSIPWSVDRSPYYQIKIPIIRLRRGSGPRLLLMAGNHGDEYEGNIALFQLARQLDTASIQGEITILPMLNAPAVLAGRRRSPLDDGNLNRAFPGDPAGTPTGRLAHFLEHVLMPAHDVVLDLHSGGTSMAHLPTSLIERQGDEAHYRRMLQLMLSLGMPYGFIAENGADAPTSMAAAARAGAIGLSGEFGGGGTVTPETMAATRSAIDNLLLATGVVAEPVLSKTVLRAKTRLLRLTSHAQAIYATRPGWFEPAQLPGDTVERGQVAGYYHDFNRPEEAEQVLTFGVAGVVLSQRLHAMSQSGDCLVQVAVPYDTEHDERNVGMA
ncbi:succinylglutamate desuccinylase/aspartoacylase family protein [Aureimonas sp. OT7]|uniref:succinylglutamate desuccinylase/aspartoacylase domain-containing protein n=1 Tax=Aureimonas sp. OT7 TaxID=2816454 RepID=UPI0017815AC4|nr:succinylglutamate desuccinylase/aspartoacylase family protein [Aureimonas sp. OT7]QOG07259.1 succinylglutamate desuccinylase/aspartoacylase family protein [Aureimonas sp. OT7]